jgi:hypothetical protein
VSEKQERRREGREQLAKLLAIDPGQVARHNEEVEKLARLCKEQEVGLIADLSRVGVIVKSVWELPSLQDRDYELVIPVLMKHLKDVNYHPRVREGIARALASPASRRCWKELRSMYEVEEGDVKVGIAVALSEAVDAGTIQDLLGLLRNPRHGSSRVLLMSGLKVMKPVERWPALEDLARDPGLSKEAMRMLRRRRLKAEER